MALGKNISWIVLTVAALALAGCGSSDGGSTNGVLAIVQDLTADPDGTTTVVTFSGPPGALVVGNFEADGGQTPQTVVVAANQASVTWDARVTPAHSVRAIGVPDVASGFTSVTTSDSSPPTFTITDGTQVSGLGGDTIEVTFAGPRVVASLAEDPSSWNLEVNGTSLDLAGSTFSLDVPTQVLDITLGQNANLHAAFTLSATFVTSVADTAVASTDVAGAATGDAAAPTLVSAVQNLTEDEYGRVVDFTFDEAMDPVFSTALSHFGVTLPEVATSVQQPTEDVLRVTFSGPVVPGTDNVTLTGLVDAHGNAWPNGPTAITQPAPVANAFDGSPAATTVENALGDTITVVTDQAFDPDSANDPTSWTLTVDGGGVTMADQTLAYDFLTKTLSITLDFDMQNGDAFDIAGAGVLEVDGQTFSQNFVGTVTGDASVPSVLAVLQNRTLDISGRTIDVQMSEDLDATEAQNTANWSLTGGINVTNAALLAGLDVVRLTLDAPAVPNDVTLTAQSLEDLAGNAMPAPQGGLGITSTDTTAPQAQSASADAIEGATNDTLAVTFNDDLVQAEIENVANWTIESPVGNALSTTGATVSYDSGTDKATLTFAAGSPVNLQRGDDFSVAIATVRDIGGNAITGPAIVGAIDAETSLPEVHTIWRDGAIADQVTIRFTEPCGMLGDLYTRYVLRDAGGMQRGLATGATVIDGGLGVEVSFGIVVDPTDTIDVLGVEDLAGNPLFPTLAVSTVAEDTNQPSLDAGFSTLVSVSGENNDVINVQFDRSMSPWGLLDPTHYTIDDGGSPIDITNAEFVFDGDRSMTIRVVGNDNLLTGISYDLTIDDVQTAQGIVRSSPETEAGIVVGGDVLAPTVIVGSVRLDPQDVNSLLIDVDEAIDETAAETASNYDYDTGTFATTATLVGPRTVRATFPVVPQIGFDLDVVATDLAGNPSGVITRAVTAADTSGPLVFNVNGDSVENRGGDSVTVTFDEAVDLATALDGSNYAVHNAGQFLDLTQATLSYDSATDSVVIHFDEGQELDINSAITVTIDNIADFSGNVMSSPVVIGGAVTGDVVVPAFDRAFVDWRADTGGTIVNVLFSEDVATAFVEDELNWTASGGQNVTLVELVNPNFARVQLDAAFGAAETLDLASGLTDVAGNVADPAPVTPEH